MRHLLWFDVAFYLVAGVYLAAHPQHSLRYAGGMGVAALAMVLWILARIQLGRAFSVSARATTLAPRS